MTSYTVDVNAAKGVRAKTTTANVVDTVTFNARVSVVEIISMDGADEIYFTLDGTDPTVGGDNTYVMPAALGSARVPVPGSGNTVFKMVTATPVRY